MATILVVNGPNLNLLGSREPEHYGTQTLLDIERRLMTLASGSSHALHAIQSNAEHELIDAVQAAGRDGTDFIILNPAGFTHTSVALRDALLATSIPFIEVHLSNVYARESFRRKSLFSDVALGKICGFGALGYELALRAGLAHLENT